MEKRVYKHTDEDISLLGFGCMRLPRANAQTQEIDKPRAQAMIEYAIAHGVNYFDTAYGYHDGLSEAFVGEALQSYPRASLRIATKMPPWKLKTPADLPRIFEEQLQKCRVSYFDYYLIHCLNETYWPKVEALRVYDYLQEEKAKGRIRRVGFSFHGWPPLLEEALDTHAWDFAQLQINYLDWEMPEVRRMYALLEERGVPLIVMEPVRGGQLATLVEEAKNILKQANPNASVASWALRFAASFGNVLTVLSGMSTIEQVQDNVRTMTPFSPLTAQEHATIKQALEAHQSALMVPCTGCRYCMDCPSGVDIPAVFALYNKYCVTKDKEDFRKEYAAFPAHAQADHCVQCKACLPLCPQGIDIPGSMEKVLAFAKSMGAIS